MKKSRIVLVVLSVLLVAALAVGGAWYYVTRQQEAQAVAEAEAGQQAAYEQYTAVVENLHQTRLTVTEQGKTIGVYDLAQLGVLEQTLADVKRACGDWDRTDPDLFVTLSAQDKIAWHTQTKRQPLRVPLNTKLLDVSGVLLDLNKEIRLNAKDAYAYLDNGAYAIASEQPGTMLKTDVVAAALQQLITGFEADTQPGQLVFEVSSCDAYLQPEVTVANGSFDYAALLQRDAKGVTIPVTFLGKTMTLDVAPVVSVDANGAVQVDTAALQQTVAAWAAANQAENRPYILQSYVDGPVELDFIRCTYLIDQPALVALLETQARRLDSTPLEAPYLCTRNGQPFGLKDTYVEVDIKNQHMTYFKDGAVLVDTDVVTGADWGYPTPEGLYAVETMDTKCWLSGPDYNVFVEYWVGFYGGYGIHDASWRTIFGGEKFLRDGSHGCVNTPSEAMAMIHSNIEKGVPVVVHDLRP